MFTILDGKIVAMEGSRAAVHFKVPLPLKKLKTLNVAISLTFAFQENGEIGVDGMPNLTFFPAVIQEITLKWVIAEVWVLVAKNQLEVGTMGKIKIGGCPLEIIEVNSPRVHTPGKDFSDE